MNRKKVIALAAGAVILIAVLLGWYLISQYNAEHVRINGQMLSKAQTSLDLSGQSVPEPAVLQQFDQLQELNIRNTGISIQEYEALKAALPDCRIQWSVPFQGHFYPEDTQVVTIGTEIALQDLEALACFPELKTIDARSCRNYGGIDSLIAAFPQAEVLWEVDVGSQKLSGPVSKLVLGDGTVEQLSLALSRFPGLTHVDARGCHDYAALMELQAQYPQCSFVWEVAFQNALVPMDTTVLTTTCDQLAALEALLPYLPYLQHVQLTDEAVDPDAAYQFQAAHRDLHTSYSFLLCGVTVSSDDTVVDLTGIPLENIQSVENSLKYFNNLQKVILVDCGLGNDVLCPLSDRNPDVHFVWDMVINFYITIRTDATYFMPYQFGAQVTTQQAQLLKYCRELVCIDLGHHSINDVSFLAYTPHVKYLILGSSDVWDISVLSGLQELVFLELFLTDVTDYSPLLSCTSLQDLNICYAPPHSIQDLKQMTWLNNLWFKGYYSEEGMAALRQSLPNTHIVFSNPESISSTGNGWRELQNYYDMRDFLGMPYMSG